MKKIKEEKGITLMVLVVMIIILLILASVGIISWKQAIDYAAYNEFTSELKVMQTKVNELNQNNKTDIGEKLTDNQISVLEIDEIKKIIYKDKTNEEIEQVKNGFRYCSKEWIKENLELDSVTRPYLINVEKRYVVSYIGFEYKDKVYYMTEQLENGQYNVEYNNKNPQTGSFEINTQKEGNRWKVEVSNIKYDGYVSNWQIKYKLITNDFWETSNELTFYINEPGEYTISVVHGDEVSLGNKDMILANFNENKGVNEPELLVGMKPIKFKEPTDVQEGKAETTTYTDENWYNYVDKKWANAQTEDGSMWVWIPRYAYRINSVTQTCDIVFLIGTTDKYYDENGNLQTAKRQKITDEIIDTKTGYTVHPAFTNESSIEFSNGGWDEELSGIWVAKFEAGYAGGNNNAQKGISSEVKYTRNIVWGAAAETGTGKDGNISARNWTDGIYGSTQTNIKYPTFQGLTYSMNYINHNDAFNISKALTGKNNIYGLNSNNADSHLMKNSEWGAVAYLSQSKYGLNGINIYVNNVNLNNSEASVYAVTGCCAGTTADDTVVITTIDNINKRTASNVYVWTQKNGTRASSTGTIYGIYDMSGGELEKTAGLVANGNKMLTNEGSSLLNNGVSNSTSTKYVTVYPSNDSGITDINIASQNNYTNTKIYGDAIRETSTNGTGQTSWYSDYSSFVGYNAPFFMKGGILSNKSNSGIGMFCFYRSHGDTSYLMGFRPVLVAK